MVFCCINLYHVVEELPYNVTVNMLTSWSCFLLESPELKFQHRDWPSGHFPGLSSVQTTISNYQLIKDMYMYMHGWKIFWKSHSEATILVTRRRWMSIYWHITVACISAWHSKLIYACYTICPKHPQAKHKLIKKT